MTDDIVTATVNLTTGNYEKLWATSALQGDNLDDTINRAIAVYAAITNAKPGTRIKWADRDGTEHRLVVKR